MRKNLCKPTRGFVFLLALLLSVSAEEQAQQRLQAEEAEEQYQSVVTMLNTTTRKTQKRE